MIHCGGSQLPDPLGIVGRFGGAGVELFFVISAFLSYQSLEKVSAKGKTSIVYGKWILRKVVSFIPVYYLSLLFSVIVVGGYPYWYGNEGVITLWNVMSHLTFTWSWVPHYCNSIIGGEWYLGTLIVFYMMGPILFKLINSFERSIVFSLVQQLLASILLPLQIIEFRIIQIRIFTKHILGNFGFLLSYLCLH